LLQYLPSPVLTADRLHAAYSLADAVPNYHVALDLSFAMMQAACKWY